MKLVEVQPDKVGTGWSKWEKVVNDFIASGVEAAEITEYDDTALSVSNALNAYIRRHEIPIRCSRRGTRVYLVREAK